MRDTRVNNKNLIAWLLPAAVFFFLPFGSLLFAPLALMSLFGLYYIYQDKIYSVFWNNDHYRSLIFIFSLIWLPMLFSLIDAANFKHSFKTVISVLPFIFVGFFMLIFLDTGKTRNKLSLALLVITSCWCFDALLQLIFGVNILGNPYLRPTRLTGIFHPKFTIGIVIAIFLPVILEELRNRARGYLNLTTGSVIASIHIAVIILSGSRNALIMMVIGIVGWFYYIISTTKVLSWKKIIIVSVITISIATGLSLIQPSRQDTLLNIFDSDIKMLDKISSSRFSLWDAAAHISVNHWINGVGPRGFRYVYKDYSPDAGIYNKNFPKASTHPHFVLLEITAETGLIGLICIIVMIIYIFRLLSGHSALSKLSAYPWFLGAFIAIIPNIAKAFYSSFMMSIVLCMIFIGLANITNEKQV